MLRAMWPLIEKRVAYLWLGLWGVAWVLAEIWNYEFELFVLPIWRTIIDLPFRVADWFADPLRWAVLFEVLVAVIIALIVWGRVRKRKAKKEAAEKEATASSEATPVSV